jgi:hypothetical protein
MLLPQAGAPGGGSIQRHRATPLQVTFHHTSLTVWFAKCSDSAKQLQFSVPFSKLHSTSGCNLHGILDTWGAIYSKTGLCVQLPACVLAQKGVTGACRSTVFFNHLDLHCCRFASEHVAAQAAAAAAAGGNPNAAGNGSSTLPAGGDPLSQPMALSAVAAADVRRVAVRTYVVPLLIGLATTSSSTRAKLWASNGLDIFLQLLGIEVCWLGGLMCQQRTVFFYSCKLTRTCSIKLVCTCDGPQGVA